MSDTPAKILGAVLVGALVLAPLTKPSKEDFEAKLSRSMAEFQEKSWKSGSILDWFVGKGVDLIRTGTYRNGLFTSEYDVYVAGSRVLHCTGALTFIWCGSSGK